MGDFQFNIIFESWRLILQGTGIAVGVALISMVVTVILGLIVVICRLANVWWLRWLAYAYIQFFRGTALYVFILWLFFGLTIVTGLQLGPLVAAVTALAVLYSAYMAEVYRSGLKAVSKGQHEAGRALGLSTFQIYRDIVIPQAIPVIIPSAMNLFIDLLKDSSLVGVIGVVDLMRVAQRLSNFYFRPFEFYTAAAVIYAIIVLFLSRVVAVRLERYFRRHQFQRV